MILKNRNYAAALTAYFLWGILPVYWKLLGGVEPMVVLAHRTVWSGFFILIYLLMNKKLLRGITAKSLMRCSISAIFLSLNWGTYIWAVGKGYIRLQA
jgi:chloramphenicol-sensitive protein RarD